MMTQKEAVYSAVINVCGKSDGAYTPTREQRGQVNNILFEGFRAGEIGYDGDVSSLTDSDLKSYVSGLQSNWLRKDKRLNGGVAYVPKNPGSRAGSTDPQIAAMRVLLSTKSDPAERAEIQSFIDRRVAELRPAKAKSLTAEQVELLKASGFGHLVEE